MSEPVATIQFLTIDDLVDYRELRLFALRESPSSFGSDAESEATMPLRKFASRLRRHGNSANGMFGAFVDERLVGTLGFSMESRRKRAHIGSLWGMYVRPEFRGQGIGAALLDRAIAHARSIGAIRQITLAVVAGNVVAKSLYESRGFVRFGLEPDALFVDGRYLDEDHMVLRIHRS